MEGFFLFEAVAVTVQANSIKYLWSLIKKQLGKLRSYLNNKHLVSVIVKTLSRCDVLLIQGFSNCWRVQGKSSIITIIISIITKKKSDDSDVTIICDRGNDGTHLYLSSVREKCFFISNPAFHCFFLKQRKMKSHHLQLTETSELQFQRQNMQQDIRDLSSTMRMIQSRKAVCASKIRTNQCKWRRKTYENRMFWFTGWGVDGSYFLNHSNLNISVLSAGKFWALCCPDSLAPHQCVSPLRVLFQAASSDVVIKKPPLTNSWTSTGFRGIKCLNSR